MNLYGANGNLKTGLPFCQFFGDQPAANGSTGSFMNTANNYNWLIENIYEPMRTANPNYITRTSIGKDASGTYDMWVYTFEPRYYKQSILLDAGIHAVEPDAVACLARIMQMITNEYENNDVLTYIRQNVKITVIPVVNVWGYSQTPKNNNNANGQRLQGFDAETPIAECANVMALLQSLKDELSFMVDMHTTTNNTYKDFYGCIFRHAKNVRTIFRVNSWLCDNYAYQGDVDDQYLGYSDLPNLLRYYAYHTCGIEASTLELSDYHWDTALSTSKVITMGVTMWLNYIFQQILDEYKLIEDIPDADYRPSRT